MSKDKLPEDSSTRANSVLKLTLGITGGTSSLAGLTTLGTTLSMMDGSGAAGAETTDVVVLAEVCVTAASVGAEESGAMRLPPVIGLTSGLPVMGLTRFGFNTGDGAAAASLSICASDVAAACSKLAATWGVCAAACAFCAAG